MSRHRRLRLVLAALLLETAVLWQRGYGVGGNVVVRCRQGHLFTTIWIPGVSLKAVRLGWWRAQYCPVGRHWSIVTPVKRSELTEEQAAVADGHVDIRIP
ncbi:MAG: hypothetical protein ACXVZ2_03415 [Gaiellaceae bacterium]